MTLCRAGEVHSPRDGMALEEFARIACARRIFMMFYEGSPLLNSVVRRNIPAEQVLA